MVQRDNDNPTRFRVGTITASQPSRTSIEALLEHVPRRATRSSSPDASSTSASIALFLTPAYARHALDPDLPLKLFDKIVGSAGPSDRSLESITAVVDRLPARDSEQIYEGLAYAAALDGSILDTYQDGIELQSSAQKPGSLYITIPRTAPSSRNTAMTSTLGLQLPLTQTIFSTGLVSTLVHASYRPAAAGKFLQLYAMRQLESHTLALPFTPRSIGFSVFLTLLTRPATVDYCMGNIVRSITPTAEQARQPASQELEAAISSYFRSRGISPEPVSVWALIIPAITSQISLSKKLQDMLERASQTEADPSRRNSFQTDLLDSECISELLDYGARFHKVLSGGGGWGKKAGLLSLDPDVAYSTRELRGEQGWDFDFSEGGEHDIQRQRDQALGQIVKKGETIMFLLAPKNVSSSTFVAPKLVDKEESGNTYEAIFGALPSSVDTAANVEAEDSTIRFHDNVFGALSEGGMALAMDSPTLHTKLDMPFSRVTVQGNQATDAPTSD